VCFSVHHSVSDALVSTQPIENNIEIFCAPFGMILAKPLAQAWFFTPSLRPDIKGGVRWSSK
jgi:hypothetical protein